MNISVVLNHVDFKIVLKKELLTYQRLDKPISCLCIKIEFMFENILSLIKEWNSLENLHFSNILNLLLLTV